MNRPVHSSRRNLGLRKTRAARVLVAASLALALSGCSQEPPIEGTVTFKTIERPTVEEECLGVPPMCSDTVIPTKYRVEVTYPTDKSLFTDAGDYWVGRECWFDVQPDEYAAVDLRDTVLLGNPSNDWGGPSGCDLAQDLAPNSFIPDDEIVP